MWALLGAFILGSEFSITLQYSVSTMVIQLMLGRADQPKPKTPRGAFLTVQVPSLARLLGPSFVNDDPTTTKLFFVQELNGVLGFLFGSHLNKAEAP